MDVEFDYVATPCALSNRATASCLVHDTAPALGRLSTDCYYGYCLPLTNRQEEPVLGPADQRRVPQLCLKYGSLISARDKGQ